MFNYPSFCIASEGKVSSITQDMVEIISFSNDWCESVCETLLRSLRMFCYCLLGLFHIQSKSRENSNGPSLLHTLIGHWQKHFMFLEARGLYLIPSSTCLLPLPDATIDPHGHCAPLEMVQDTVVKENIRYMKITSILTEPKRDRRERKQEFNWFISQNLGYFIKLLSVGLLNILFQWCFPWINDYLNILYPIFFRGIYVSTE